MQDFIRIEGTVSITFKGESGKSTQALEAKAERLCRELKRILLAAASKEIVEEIDKIGISAEYITYDEKSPFNR